MLDCLCVCPKKERHDAQCNLCVFFINTNERWKKPHWISSTFQFQWKALLSDFVIVIHQKRGMRYARSDPDVAVDDDHLMRPGHNMQHDARTSVRCLLRDLKTVTLYPLSFPTFQCGLYFPSEFECQLGSHLYKTHRFPLVYTHRGGML